MATAISFIPLATIAMMSLAMLCAADYRRTSGTAEGAQLRLMLLAAAIDARDHLTAVGNTTTAPSIWETPLPVELASLGGRVRTDLSINGNAAQLTITAALGSRTATQQMNFNRNQNRWTPASVQLIDTSE
jgi:hypothetical protein